MTNVMKSVRHCTLEGSTGVLETERELLIGKSSPWTDKGGFVLVSRGNIYLVIPRKTVHKGVHFTPSTLVNKLINKGCGEIIFRAGLIDITVINTNTDGTLFFILRHDVGDPIYEQNGVNEAGFEKLFYFCLNSCSLSRVHGA